MPTLFVIVVSGASVPAGAVASGSALENPAEHDPPAITLRELMNTLLLGLSSALSTLSSSNTVLSLAPLQICKLPLLLPSACTRLLLGVGVCWPADGGIHALAGFICCTNIFCLRQLARLPLQLGGLISGTEKEMDPLTHRSDELLFVYKSKPIPTPSWPSVARQQCSSPAFPACPPRGRWSAGPGLAGLP